MLYQIDPEKDLMFAREFLDKPLGSPSPGLSRVLNRLRYDPTGHQLFIFTKVPFKEFVLAEMPPEREKPLVFMEEFQFSSIEEAEVELFKMRWKALTGKDLDAQLSE
ncbi:hypothetical protein HC752_14750 [Vibrio sp. S9_S30]|uniref:hypothetical protein n=1 Tax=Vibrio sp. S9_S30 TaxID=2720226 RepID=UPI00167FFBA6|nr:hypothetical protein [Vibrio sp. S9_S30]MBD1558195.1 hypothetical protein [Vibrio sp. S9_S30]